MRKLFLIGAVFCLSAVGCDSSEDIAKDIVDTAIPTPSKADPKMTFDWNLGGPYVIKGSPVCDKTEAELEIPAEVNQSAIKIAKDVPSQNTQILGCDGKTLIHEAVDQLDRTTVRVDLLPEDFPRKGEVRYVEVLNLRTCTSHRVDVESPQSSEAISKGLKSVLLPDGGVRIVLERLDSLRELMALGFALEDTGYVKDGLALLDVRYFGPCIALKQDADPNLPESKKCITAEVLHTTLVRVDLTFNQQLIPGTRTEILCGKKEEEKKAE